MVSIKVSADTAAHTYALTAEISAKNFFNFLQKVSSIFYKQAYLYFFELNVHQNFTFDFFMVFWVYLCV